MESSVVYIGINEQRIVNSAVEQNESNPLSGPFPAGVGLDPAMQSMTSTFLQRNRVHSHRSQKQTLGGSVGLPRWPA